MHVKFIWSSEPALSQNLNHFLKIFNEEFYEGNMNQM